MTNTFDALDRVVSVFTPNPGNGGVAQKTSYTFDSLGRIATITHPDSQVLNKEYFDSGELKKTWGAREYPVEYTYDYAGRMKTMKTWQNYAGGAGTPAITTWNYSSNRGWLTSKDYADATTGSAGTVGTDYTYTPAGRLYQRTWARGVTTTYMTNSAGEIASIDYSDSTPDVTYTYDRLGRRTTIADAAGTHVLSYDLDRKLLSETNTAGLLVGHALTNAYDALRLRSAIGLVGDAKTLVNFRYDNASRLIGVSNALSYAGYTYVANSPLVSQIAFTNNGSQRMTTIKSFDNLID